MKLEKNPLQHSIKTTVEEQQKRQAMTTGPAPNKAGGQGNTGKALGGGTMDFKNRAVIRIHEQLQDARMNYGERRKLGMEQVEYVNKQRKTRDDLQHEYGQDGEHLEDDHEDEGSLTAEEELLANEPDAEELEKIKAEYLDVSKPVQIVQTRREVFQLYRNIWIFYDKDIEKNNADGQTIQ